MKIRSINGFDRLFSAIMMLDLDGNIVYQNKACADSIVRNRFSVSFFNIMSVNEGNELSSLFEEGKPCFIRFSDNFKKCEHNALIGRFKYDGAEHYLLVIDGIINLLCNKYVSASQRFGPEKIWRRQCEMLKLLSEVFEELPTQQLSKCSRRADDNIIDSMSSSLVCRNEVSPFMPLFDIISAAVERLPPHYRMRLKYLRDETITERISVNICDYLVTTVFALLAVVKISDSRNLTVTNSLSESTGELLVRISTDFVCRPEISPTSITELAMLYPRDALGLCTLEALIEQINGSSAIKTSVFPGSTKKKYFEFKMSVPCTVTKPVDVGSPSKACVLSSDIFYNILTSQLDEVLAEMDME